LAFAEDEIHTSIAPNSIGLNIGTSDNRIWGDEKELTLEFIKLASFAKKANWTVKWFVVWPKDLEITKTAARISNTSNDIYEIYDDYKKYIQLVKPLNTFVGMKLHATILATCAFVPSIMLEYRPKCRDYMKSIGQESSTIRTDEFRAENVWEIIRFWQPQRSELTKGLFTSIKSLQKKQQLKADELIIRMGIG
jgi:polysaccharide pyruvyl transferase WcaK-like protein